MPTSSSGRESRRSSKSGPSGNEAVKSSERREKAKSTQSYDTRRRGSRQVESGLGSVSERPGLNGRTNSAPLIEPLRRDGERGGQTEQDETGSSTPRAGGETLDAQDEDEVAGVVGAVRNFQPFQNPEISEPVPDINIAVLGAEGVGKSTFVKNALELASPPDGQAAERKLSIKGEDYLVRLLEVPIADVDIDDDDETVSWPETIEDKMMPRIDGALTLYDIRDQGSLEYVPQVLTAISKSGIPSVLVSCKCDASPEEIDVDPDEIEKKARRSLKSLETLQTSASIPGTQRQGLSMIIKSILATPPANQARSSSSQRQRAQSNAVRPVSPRPPSHHTRATSEYAAGAQKGQRHSRHDSRDPGYQSKDKDRLGVQHESAPPEMSGSFFFEESASEASFESTRLGADAEPYLAPMVQSVSALSEHGATFDELVDRLLARPTSKADNKFGAIFLALYRKFAPPGRLLEAIVERWDALDRDGSAPLLRTASQVRYIDILETWVGTYPGDFAFPKTKKRMRTFISKASRDIMFAAAGKVINAELDSVSEDDDTNWAYCDKDRVLAENDAHWVSMSVTASKLIDDPTWSFGSDFTLSGSTLLDDSSTVQNNDDDITRSMSSASLASQVVMNAEAAQKQAELLTPNPKIPISKVYWRLLMEYPDEVLARELTRMDWIMFASIRPRDLVRQVSLNDEQKALCKNLSHVSRMINHFNHLATWVANFILLRDKPKHRALMMEKLMRVARKLRELNNYNALGAFIAGIKSTPIHRLAATKELIPQAVSRSWSSLELLMTPTKSYSAYRLAWEVSANERIPYLPLHRRDLVSAEQGNRTFTGDEKSGRINWKKFEIMGEVVVSLQKAQGTPYKSLGSIRGGEGIKELVLDIRLVKDEDALDERSKQIEPMGASGAAGTTSTKFKEFFKR